MCFSALIEGSPEIFIHEAYLPALQSPSRPYARLPRPHEDPWRPQRHRCPSRQGSQASRRLIPDVGLNASPVRNSRAASAAFVVSASPSSSRTLLQLVEFLLHGTPGRRP